MDDDDDLYLQKLIEIGASSDVIDVARGTRTPDNFVAVGRGAQGDRTPYPNFQRHR